MGGRDVQGLRCATWKGSRAPGSLGSMAALPWDGPVTGPGARAGSLESHVERLSLGEWLTGE